MNINRVTLTGRLTRDPELRSTASGLSVCRFRIACNTRRKGPDGEWVDKPNFFDVTVWGARGEACAQHLARGRPVAVDGRLEWHEWVDQDGARRQAVHIVADVVQFLGDQAGAARMPDDAPAQTAAAPASAPAQAQMLPDQPAVSRPANAIVGPDVPDDDIPF